MKIQKKSEININKLHHYHTRIHLYIIIENFVFFLFVLFQSTFLIIDKHNTICNIVKKEINLIQNCIEIDQLYI